MRSIALSFQNVSALNRRSTLVVLGFMLAFAAAFTMSTPRAAQAAPVQNVAAHVANHVISLNIPSCPPGQLLQDSPNPPGFACVTITPPPTTPPPPPTTPPPTTPPPTADPTADPTAAATADPTAAPVASSWDSKDTRLNHADAAQSVAIYCNADGTLNLTPILAGGTGDQANTKSTASLVAITTPSTYGDITITPGTPAGQSWTVSRQDVNDTKQYTFTVTATSCPQPVDICGLVLTKANPTATVGVVPPTVTATITGGIPADFNHNHSSVAVMIGGLTHYFYSNGSSSMQYAGGKKVSLLNALSDTVKVTFTCP